MQIAIIASITGQIYEITTGVIEAGSPLFTTEAMKMYIAENTPIRGTFEAVVAVGAMVVVGETVIGYFTATHE